MTKHNKTMTKKQKVIMYASAITAAVIAAIIMVLIIVHLLKNPPAIIVNSNDASHLSTSNYNESTFLPITENKPDNNINPDAPRIKGIKNGTIYYTTQHVTVSDNNLKSVTVNGEDCNKSFFIDGNETNMFIIEAIDADENITTYIIYTKPISTLLEPINHLNDNTVTAEDFEIINNVKKTALKLETKYSNNTEATSLDNVLTTCDKYINKINSVADKISYLENKVKEYETTDNHTDVNQVVTDIEALLSTGNLTSDQRIILEKLNSKCQFWLNPFIENEPTYQNIE